MQTCTSDFISHLSYHDECTQNWHYALQITFKVTFFFQGQFSYSNSISSFFPFQLNDFLNAFLTRIQFLVDRVINCFTQKISYSTLTSLIIKGFLNVFVLILRTKNLQGNKLKFAKYRVNSTKLFIFIFTICSTKNLL